jgi:hypothetical protein
VKGVIVPPDVGGHLDWVLVLDDASKQFSEPRAVEMNN